MKILLYRFTDSEAGQIRAATTRQGVHYAQAQSWFPMDGPIIAHMRGFPVQRPSDVVTGGAILWIPKDWRSEKSPGSLPDFYRIFAGDIRDDWDEVLESFCERQAATWQIPFILKDLVSRLFPRLLEGDVESTKKADRQWTKSLRAINEHIRDCSICWPLFQLACDKAGIKKEQIFQH